MERRGHKCSTVIIIHCQHQRLPGRRKKNVLYYLLTKSSFFPFLPFLLLCIYVPVKHAPLFVSIINTATERPAVSVCQQHTAVQTGGGKSTAEQMQGLCVF